jgi:hypothetical protein
VNLLPLLAGFLPWARTPADALVRVFIVIGLLSIEMQVVTLTGVGSLRQLAPVNLLLAVAAIVWQARSSRPTVALVRSLGDGGWLGESWRVVPWPGLAALAGTIVLLNAVLPVEAADPYNMQRIVHIQQVGTLAYAPGADFKVNLVGFLHELVLADLALVPGSGGGLMRFHGLLGLQLYLLGLATVRGWLVEAGSRRWPWLLLLVVPVVFHQLVLIKNDLFLAVPALVVLAWLLTRAAAAAWPEVFCYAALIGLVAGYKPTNLPLAAILAGAVVFAQRGRGGRVWVFVVAGGALGAVAGGLPFGMLENLRVYGDPFARAQVATLGNVTTGVASAGESLLRFGISLFDLGQLTRRMWPGRGGWGGTFGLAFVWALCILAPRWRLREARWSLLIAAVHFFAFAATFPDADVAHRLAMAPALLVIAVAVATVARDDAARMARLALVPVLALSAAQLALSTVNYLQR